MNWWWRVLGFVFVATRTGGRNTEISISIIMLEDRVIYNFWETVKGLLYFVKKLNYQLIVRVWSVSPEILTEMSRSPAHNILDTVNKLLYLQYFPSSRCSHWPCTRGQDLEADKKLPGTKCHKKVVSFHPSIAAAAAAYSTRGMNYVVCCMARTLQGRLTLRKPQLQLSF